ncbi:glycoside hydrolase family 43 protein [Porticoccus sp. GXU_MW_L64]
MTKPNYLSSFLGILLLAILSACAVNDQHINTTFKPGEVWLDTDGEPINAHGGGILYQDGTYYWYGEYKTGVTQKVGTDSWRVNFVGISCYSSKDLLNWKNHGLVLTASDDPDSDFHPSQAVERPKVLFNKKTGKYVMWMHVDGPQDGMLYGKAASAVAVADSPTGPFEYHYTVRPNAGVWPENFDPNAPNLIEGTDKLARKQRQAIGFIKAHFEGGQYARDMTLFQDDDGTAYHVYSSEQNRTLHISQLSDDYLQHSGKYQRFFPGRHMEAPAIFKRNGKYYLMASGTSGWNPNPARSAVADSIWGPWKELGNPAVGEGADVTFRSQSTFVLPVAGKKDAFIYMGDRWVKQDLQDSRYIWLPVEFTDEGYQIKWKDKWGLDN